MALGTVSCIVAFVNIGLTLHYFAAEIVRVGDNLKDFSYASEGLGRIGDASQLGDRATEDFFGLQPMVSV